MANPEQNRYREILRRLDRLEKAMSVEKRQPYTKDFIYFVVSMFLPLGYGEVDLIPRDSIWHPIVGWACWAIPLFFLTHLLWNWLQHKGLHRAWSTVVPITICLTFMACAASAIRAFVNRRGSEEQQEVYKNLSPHVLAPLTENVMESVFSITNGSSKTTISSGLLFCGITQIQDQNGHPVVAQLSSAAVPNASRLVPGDSRSEPCLMMWSRIVTKAQCVDMNLWMQYTIEPQSTVTKERWFRLVGYQARGGGFNWYPEPVGSTIDYCDYFRRQVAPPL